MSNREMLVEAMTELNEEQVMACVQAMIEEGVSVNAIQMGLNVGVTNVGKRFENGDYFIADLIVSGMIYRDALRLLMPVMSGNRTMPIGRIVIGVVAGDIHDIGKDIVVGLLRAEHFEVIDLGVDVRPEKFVEACRENPETKIVGLSALLTTTMPAMKETVSLLNEQDFRKNIKIMVGGAPITQAFAEEIGADVYTPDAASCAQKAKELVS